MSTCPCCKERLARHTEVSWKCRHCQVVFTTRTLSMRTAAERLERPADDPLAVLQTFIPEGLPN